MGTAEKAEDLRARVREGTRAEVGMAALDLFAEKGFEETTAGEAADAAGISRASFFRLFSSKEEAVFARQEATGGVIAAALLARPAEEDHWLALCSAFTSATTVRYLEDPERALARARLILENPSLRARRLEVHANWSGEIREALAERTGGDPDSMEIEAVVGAALGAFDAATTRWGASGGGDLVALIEESFAAVAALFAD